MKVFIAVLLVVFTTQVNAFGIANSKVASVRVDKNGSGIVEFEDPILHEPASCVSSYQNHLSFDTNTAGGKSIYSMVLAALAADKKIVAYGTGTCTSYPSDVEAWSYGHVYK